MRFFFIRHAEAVEAEDFDGDDMLRPLTRAGRRKAAAAYKRLAKIIPKPDAIVSSEAVRAVQTAELIQAHLRGPRLVQTAHFNPGCGLNGFRRFVKTVRRKDMVIAIVGHEPDLSTIISHLVASGKLDMRMKKGACADVEVNIGGRGVLRSLLTLNALAGGP